MRVTTTGAGGVVVMMWLLTTSGGRSDLVDGTLRVVEDTSSVVLLATSFCQALIFASSVALLAMFGFCVAFAWGRSLVD